MESNLRRLGKTCESASSRAGITFGISGADRRRRDFSLYLVGSLLQLGLGLTGYALLIGRLGLDATPAFILNTAVTASFNFLFLRFVTFRRVDADA